MHDWERPVGRARPRGARHDALAGAPEEDAACELEKVADLCEQLDVCGGQDFTERPLEAIAGLIRAETASLRLLARTPNAEMPRLVARLGIPDRVDDAYVARYHELDPSKRLAGMALSGPIFADPGRPGVWSNEHAGPAAMRRYLQDFADFRTDFLIPSGFCHHVAFCVPTRGVQMLLFDFHRGRRSSPFDPLDFARTHLVARYLHARAINGSAPAENSDTGEVSAGNLSAREFEVAEAVALGLSNKEVAAALRISVRTVENHLRAIFIKLHVSSRTRLAAKVRHLLPRACSSAQIGDVARTPEEPQQPLVPLLRNSDEGF